MIALGGKRKDLCISCKNKIVCKEVVKTFLKIIFNGLPEHTLLLIGIQGITVCVEKCQRYEKNTEKGEKV